MSDVTVVTGAGAGIGRAIAERLALSTTVIGVDLAFSCADRSGLRRLVLDVGEEDAFDSVQSWLSPGERLSGWVNNAAVALPGALHSAARQDVRRTWAVNADAYFRGSAAAVQLLLAQGGGGAIVNVSSIQATHAFPGWAAYVTAKGAVDALTRYTAVEYGGQGIRCNAVAPGNVRTPLAAGVVEQAAQPAAMQDVMDQMAPIPRMAEPAEVAAGVAFLLSDDAAYITGHTLVVDGGATARCYPMPSATDHLTAGGAVE